jgi:hypothetical protein
MTKSIGPIRKLFEIAVPVSGLGEDRYDIAILKASTYLFCSFTQSLIRLAFFTAGVFLPKIWVWVWVLVWVGECVRARE